MSSEDTLEKIKKQLEDHEKRISKLEAEPQAKAGPVTKKLSIKEFIISKKPKGDIQKTLAIGYYLEKHESFASFNIKDLASGFRAAKEPVPDNINRKVIGNISKGHMMEAEEKKDSKKAWVLTNSGEAFVESGFQEKK